MVGMCTRPSEPPPPPTTIWYMGVKTRLLEPLEAAIAPLLAARSSRTHPPRLLDLLCGTGVVGARLAPRASVWATDAQAYACVLARARLQPAAGLESALERCLQRAERAREALFERYGAVLEAERRWFERAEEPGSIDAYCRWAEQEASGHDPARACAGCRPDTFPPRLVTAYYRNVYFGVRQAIELDALRWAIEAESEPAARNALLAALLFAASRATSATAHFAQPRALSRRSERERLVQRRQIDVRARFVERLQQLEREQAAQRARGGFRHPHRVERREVVSWTRTAVREPVDVVYADPPYTADNYSRFYHVLETLVHYDYPPLATRAGRLTRGRYPALERRLRSPFSSPATVEAAFAAVCGFAARLGAALVWSYARPNGLLIRRVYDGQLAPFERLLGRFYREVEITEIPLAHSGAGSRALRTHELIAVCREPRSRPLPVSRKTSEPRARTQPAATEIANS
ncbi:MAG: hypothetical protein D6776_05255 [Planctomycetota bacterium]|nr:MAG: hypothetical protein D6776_05255 [Planctomycetota bacterium]